jgi:hypothetical protein
MSRVMPVLVSYHTRHWIRVAIGSYGPIHLTPSIWRTCVAWPSFAPQDRTLDERHPRFPELFDLALLRRSVTPQEWQRLWRWKWDTAQKAWFAAAVRDRAALVRPPGPASIKHFWCGTRTDRHRPELDGLLAALAGD